MAGFLGTEHYFLQCEYADISEALPRVIWHTETPILRTSPVPMFLLSQLVRSHHFKVVMTGEGADEFLAGYDIFKEMKIRRFWAVDPESKYRPKLLTQLYPNIRNISASKAFLTGFFRKDLEQTDSPFYSHLVRWHNTARTMRFFSESSLRNQTVEPFLPDLLLPPNFRNWPSLSQAQYIEIMTFLSPYLLSSQGDRMAMAHSVEGRYPFLDHRVIEFCNRLPPEMKMPVLHEKWLLKQLGSKYLPESIWRRRKRPYRAPIHHSFFTPSPPAYVTELLSSAYTADAGYFEPMGVQMLYGKALHSSENGTRLSEVEEMALIGILSTHLVHQQFVRDQGAQSHNRLRFEEIKVIDRLKVAP
jgi:asparagine synthase (glutamine-hydrolysing)